MEFDEALKKYTAKAKSILKKNNILEIIFFENTYEVDVFDEKEKKKKAKYPYTSGLKTLFFIISLKSHLPILDLIRKN